MLPRVFRGGVRAKPSLPTYYPTPYDRKRARVRAALWVLWFLMFTGLGILMAWRF